MVATAGAAATQALHALAVACKLATAVYGIVQLCQIFYLLVWSATAPRLLQASITSSRSGTIRNREADITSEPETPENDQRLTRG